MSEIKSHNEEPIHPEVEVPQIDDTKVVVSNSSQEKTQAEIENPNIKKIKDALLSGNTNRAVKAFRKLHNPDEANSPEISQAAILDVGRKIC